MHKYRREKLLFIHSRKGISLMAENSVNRLIAETAAQLAGSGLSVSIVAPDLTEAPGVIGFQASHTGVLAARKQQLIRHLPASIGASSDFSKASLQTILTSHFSAEETIVICTKYVDAQLVKEINTDYTVVLWTHHYQHDRFFMKWLYGETRPDAWVLPTLALQRRYEQDMSEKGVWFPVMDIPYYAQPAFAPSRSKSADNSIPVMLFLGGENPNKGLHHIVAAMHLLPQDCQTALQVLGCAASKTIKLPNGCSIQYQTAASRDGVKDMVAKADIGLVPSTWFENSPTAFIEMASSGLWMIASRVGGIPEIAGKDAILIDNHNNPSAWAEAMVDAIKNLQTIQQQRQKRSEQYMAQRPSSQHITQLWQTLINMLQPA